MTGTDLHHGRAGCQLLSGEGFGQQPGIGLSPVHTGRYEQRRLRTCAPANAELGMPSPKQP
ncbi:hypothetical protein ACFV2S_06115 [Streptomyces sp. NPDC059695]|uniref:hypothetical protein n=1 Tax=Streptomyces sp. NPDC059695 TaxID=3346910 RepID=UPI00367681EA